MPFFRYSAYDATGKPVTGTIQAASADEALSQLSGKGFRQARLMTGLSSPPPPQGKVVPEARPVQRPTPSAAPQPPQQQRPVVKTRKIGDKQRFFLFAQIAQQLKAGISPAQVFSTVGGLSSDDRIRDSLQYAATCAQQGIPISEALAVYPNLYPEHVVGMIKAGEEGGFLPDACRKISEHAEAAHKFKRFHWFIWIIGINALLALPLVFLATRAFLVTYEKVDKKEGLGIDVIATWFQSFGEKLREYGPWLLLIYGLIVVLYVYFSSNAFKMQRHKLGLKWPFLGRRARHESINIFAGTMSRLAEAGIPPYRTWTLAADSVPNLEMRRRLVNAGSKMGHEAKMSDVIFGSKLFPEEFAPMVSTGELTGDISGVLQQLADASQTEFEAATSYARMRTAGWGCLGGCLTAGIILILFTYFWYNELYGKMLEGLEPTGAY